MLAKKKKKLCSVSQLYISFALVFHKRWSKEKLIIPDGVWKTPYLIIFNQRRGFFFVCDSLFLSLSTGKRKLLPTLKHAGILTYRIKDLKLALAIELSSLYCGHSKGL